LRVIAISSGSHPKFAASRRRTASISGSIQAHIVIAGAWFDTAR